MLMHTHCFCWSYPTLIQWQREVKKVCFKLCRFSRGEAFFCCGWRSRSKRNGSIVPFPTVVLPAERNADGHVMKYTSPGLCHWSMRGTDGEGDERRREKAEAKCIARHFADFILGRGVIFKEGRRTDHPKLIWQLICLHVEITTQTQQIGGAVNNIQATLSAPSLVLIYSEYFTSSVGPVCFHLDTTLQNARKTKDRSVSY